MSYTTGIELSKGRITKAEALKRVYMIKGKYNTKNSLGGVCTFPQALVGLRFKVMEVKQCQTDK